MSHASGLGVKERNLDVGEIIKIPMEYEPRNATSSLRFPPPSRVLVLQQARSALSLDFTKTYLAVKASSFPDASLRTHLGR